MSEKQKKLIIGCGNLLLKDEGFGVHLIEYLKQRKMPANVDLLDAGTAALDLIDFLHHAEKVIIVDAVKAKGKPADIYSFSPQDFETDNSLKTSLHDITLKDVFRMAAQLAPLPKIKIIGIEPESIDPGTELSPKLKKMLPKVTKLVLNEIENV